MTLKFNIPVVFITLCIAMSFASCKKDNTNTTALTPIINFCPMGDTLFTGEPVTFSLCSTSASYSYLWDFGDGNTSTLSSKIHSYNAAGTYTVSMQLTEGSLVNNQSFLVKVKNLPAGYWGITGGVSPSMFGGNSYGAYYCDTTQLTLMAVDSVPTGGNIYNRLIVSFSSYPVTGGSYTVTNGMPSAGQVYILAVMYHAGSTVVLTSAAVHQTVTVTVTNGKINVTGKGIEMLNPTLSQDNEALNFNITQLQYY